MEAEQEFGIDRGPSTIANTAPLRTKPLRSELDIGWSVKAYKRAMRDDIDTSVQILQAPRIRNYNNQAHYHDIAQLQPELIPFLDMTTAQQLSFFTAHGDIMVLQMMDPLYGWVDIPRCFQDGAIKHYLDYVVTHHMLEEERNRYQAEAVPHVLHKTVICDVLYRERNVHFDVGEENTQSGGNSSGPG